MSEFKEERYEVAGHRVHIAQDFDNVTVWLNTGETDYDGLCIGAGATRQEAVTEAVVSLEAVVEQLQQPEPIPTEFANDRPNMASP